MLKLIAICLMFDTCSGLQCYSCSNCDDAQDLVECGLGDTYCLTIQMYFFDYVTHKACSPTCDPSEVDHIYKFTCCEEDGCNGADTIVSPNLLPFFLLALFFISKY